MEDDAAGLVLRLALKTRFSEMGWGSTPPSSANRCGPIMVLERIANPSLGESRVLSSSLSRTTKLMPARLGSQRGLISLLAPD